MRLDVLLVQQGYFSSRELAKENIIHGNVLVNGLIAKKPSMIVSEDALITLEKENTIPYVSRGGLKLEKALSRPAQRRTRDDRRLVESNRPAHPSIRRRKHRRCGDIR